MNKKIILYIFAIIILLPTIAMANTKNTPATVNVTYSYNKSKNTVTAVMKSNIKLKATKASWKLSTDKLSYTYEFKKNTSYTTTLEDINGNKISVPIKVTQIDDKGPVLNISYQYMAETNTVRAIVKSNEELGATKKSWVLSKDKLTYTYDFKDNTKYTTTFADKWGNKSNITINVTQINKKGPKLEISYQYISSNNTVKATVKSDKVLGATKKSWTLSKDKLSYTNVFKDNTKYATTFEDKWGNKSSITINVTQIDKTGPKLEISYEYSATNNTVKATVKSNEELSATKKSWKLSSDKLTYSYEFKDNANYTTTFADKWGNESKIQININQIDRIAPKVTVQYVLNNNNTVTVKLISNEALKPTKKSWTFSADKKTYTYTFNKDTDYATTLEDLAGNGTVVRIRYKVKVYNYAGSPNITVKYLYTSNEQVLVKVISDQKLRKTKQNWTLSADGYTYSYTFTSNSIYDTSFTTTAGKQVPVSIIVNFFKNKNRYDGVDVSVYQKIIDWAAVKRSGIDFAIIRAGYRGYGASGSMNLDMYFEQNLKNAYLNGIDVGVYFFSQAITEKEAIEEADFVLNLVRKYNIPIRYPIAIDTERTPVGTGRADNISTELRTRICKAFCNRIQQAGYKSMIYANKYWLLNNLNIKELSQYDIWLAHYTSETDYKYSYTTWQYTSSGTVNGIVGNVDRNYCYKKY